MDNGASSYRRFLSGDDEGLYEIICTYQNSLFLYLNSLVQNVQLAEDLTEDTFAELAIKQPRFLEKSSFKTWLFAIGRHLAAKALRKHKNITVLPLETQLSLTDDTNLETACIKNEQKDAIHQALQHLKPDYRQVLYLTYFEDFKNAEVCIIMKKNKRQIENLLYNAKKALKADLERSGFHYEEL